MPSGDESAYVAFMDRISHADLTPEELNQPEPWTGINAYRSDPLLVDISSAMPRAVREEFDVIGRYATAHEAQELARMANQNPPELPTHGPRGERLDIVDFHPAWHALMRRSVARRWSQSRRLRPRAPRRLNACHPRRQ